MKSAASIHAHPIHPMIVPFPFAFLAGAWGFGVAGEATGNADLKTVSRYLVPVGLAAGLLAAVPGLIDYFGSVPPQSSAKGRAAKHGLLNVASLALFSLGWLTGRKKGHNHYLPLALQSAGVTTLSMAGWLGGTLVVRNQIGVDHRYADAGTSQEETLEPATPVDASGGTTPSTVDAHALGEAATGLSVNQMKLVHAGSERIAIGRTGKGYVAFQDRCTHKGGPLSDGMLACGVVQCPWHGSQFDVRTGHVKAGPAEKNIETYEIQKRDEVATSRAVRRPRGSSRR